MTDADRPRQRRRRRATAPQGPPQDGVRTTEQPAPADTAPPAGSGEPEAVRRGTAPIRGVTATTRTKTKKARHNAGTRPGGPDRGLHDLVGGGSSQLDASRALRARDVNRPTDADLAAAERDLQIVRRNWRPQ